MFFCFVEGVIGYILYCKGVIGPNIRKITTFFFVLNVNFYNLNEFY